MPMSGQTQPANQLTQQVTFDYRNLVDVVVIVAAAVVFVVVVVIVVVVIIVASR